MRGTQFVLGAAAMACLLAFFPARAGLALTQPNGAQVPSPMGCSGGKPTGLAAALACVCDVPGVCNIGQPCTAPGVCDDGENAVCETTLRHVFNDNTCIPSTLVGLDPYTQAALVPETFRPTCGLTFTVVTRGTAMFGDVFGWYNVTGSRPSLDDLHPMIDCDDGPGTQVTLDLASHPAYRGGEIGFFLATPESHSQRGTCAGGDCCASVDRLRSGVGHLYFSERRYNDDNAGPASFIHLLILDSRVTPRKFYFAWEDIYGGSNNDFTDLVTSVEGIECAGGGEACDTGEPGLCAAGVSRCDDGALGCVRVYDPRPEICDGVDDDCDGRVDDGATCPEPDEICEHGRCVPHCELAKEFDCPIELVCDGATGRCVDPACVGVSCPEGKICRAGTCATPCDGIVCPRGTECLGGVCVDPCEGVVCPAGEVCARGACLPGCGTCAGLLCADPLVCDAASGRCVDPSCPAGCPAGAFCDNGVCRDACEGAVCPRGQICETGRCVDPSGGGGVGGDGGGGPGGGGPGGGAASENGDASGGCGCVARGAAVPRDAMAALLLPIAGCFLGRRRGGPRRGSGRR